MTAPRSPQNFAIVRGRGYRPGQVDERVAALSEERDRAWERLARLTVLDREMSAEAAQLTAKAAALPAPSFATLGARAQLMLSETEAGAAELRAAAVASARSLGEEAGRAARELLDGARASARRRRAEADASAESLLDRARADAGELLAAAQEEAEASRAEAQAALAEMTQRCAAVGAGRQEEEAAHARALEEELAGRHVAWERRIADLSEHGERVLAAAERELAEAERQSRQLDADGEAEATEVLARAEEHAQRISRDAQQAVRDHVAESERLRNHLEQVRDSLTVLASRTAPVPGEGPALPHHGVPSSRQAGEDEGAGGPRG